MNPTSVVAFFSTTRNFYKYVINEDRELSQVAPFQPALDYSPNSGKRIGILVEQASTNYFPDSENLASAAIQKKNCSIVTRPIAGSTATAQFPSGNSESWIGCNTNITATHVAVSFFVQQSNLQRPVMGYAADERSTFIVLINGVGVNVPMTDVDIQGPLNDLSYRVRLRCYVPGGQCNNIKIYKSPIHSQGMLISRIQFEPEVWTSYIPTTGTIKTRPAETVYRNLTHGVDINENQGSFDVLFTAVPGAKGSAMTVLKDDWSEYVAIGHQQDENGDPEAIRFYTSSTIVELPLRSHHEDIRKKYAGIRFSYSGFGVRGAIRETSRVAKLKDFNSFKNGKFNKLMFGESYDGTHFTGHIHLMNTYARVFDDEEMLDFPYVPNDSSHDPDYDLDKDTVFATAAAIFRTDEEALLYQNVVEPPTPQRILAAWPRASSHYVALNPDHATGNGKRWYFDPARYSFVQPMNSGQIEQILSPIRVNEFTFEATLKCDEYHGDAMGLVAAADIINGQLYSIIVAVDANWGMVGSRTMARPFGIFLYTPETPNAWGAFGTMLAGSHFLPRGNWNGDSTRIKITRQGTFLSVVATNWNGTEYDLGSELVYNLANLTGPALKLGLEPARYGFMSHSQPGSYYLDYELKSPQVIDAMKIYSLESNSYWKFVDGSWQLQDETATDDILPATRINNKVTKENYLIDEETGEMSFDKNIGIPYGEATITVPKNKTTDIDMSVLLDQFEYFEPLYFFNSYNESNVIAEQIEIGGVTKLRIVANVTNGHFIALIGNESQVDGFGIKEETIAFRKVNVVVT